MTIGTMEQTGVGFDTTTDETALLEESGPIPIKPHEIRYPTEVLSKLLIARLLTEPMPIAPDYVPSGDCLADETERVKRAGGTIPGSFVGVPRPCSLGGCGAICIPSHGMGVRVTYDNIPRTACRNTVDHNLKVLQYDKDIAAYNLRHPQEGASINTDAVSPVAGELETEAALASELGVSAELVHELAGVEAQIET